MELVSLRRRLLSFAMGGMLTLGAAVGAYSAPPAYAEGGSLTPGAIVTTADDGDGDDAAPEMKDGTFTGTRYGYRSDVTIAVTVEGGKIVGVECVSQDEDDIYWEKAVTLLDQILDEQTTDLDTVSGATISSRAILRAAQSAIDQSTGNDSTKPAAGIFAGGDGTRTNPFLIETADQLRAFAQSMSLTVDYEGYYVKLNADVDVSGANWVPVGSTADGMLQFQGDFNGDGHTISGLTFGTEDAPMVLDASHREVGLFGITGSFAKIHDFAIAGLQANVSCPTTTHFGAVVGNTKPPAAGTVGTFIDGVSVSGKIKVSTTMGTQRVGGIVGYQNRGTVVMNSWTDVDLTTTDAPTWVQVGAISGINNRGLVVNCYSLGNLNSYGSSANRVAGSLLSGDYGDAVNCYTMGNVTTSVASDCIGAVGGELDEGNVFNSWYNQAATLTVGENEPVALPAVGETNITNNSKDNYISDDGLTYEGHVIENNNGFTADQLETVKDALNASFASFPMDIENLYGVPAGALRTWVIQDGVLTLSKDTRTFTFSRPAATRVPQATLPMLDGTWYGRDADQITTVKIVTKDNKVVSTEVVEGSNKQSDISNARAVARTKAIYGDASGYGEADPSVFAGGSGTAEDPYQVASEEQLRYIATAINEDVDWDGVYFKQTADIQLSDEEWLPIGYMIQGYYHSQWQTFASYPFRGNFDGDGHTITGLHIGTASAPSADPRMQVVAGFIGYVVGGVSNNYALKDNSIVREVKNVNIKDALINVQGLSNVYAAGLVAYANNGFTIDRCSVQGAVKANGMETTLELTDYEGATSTTVANTKNLYAGGIFGYGLRGGLIKDTTADVNVAAEALDGSTTTVYAGGLFGMDNRTTAINDCALGDVVATAAANRAYVGGLTGYSAGAHYNVCTTGNVASTNASNYVGGTSGTFKMVGADFNVFYNGDATQTVAGAAKAEPAAYGAQDADAQNASAAAKTAAELGSSALATTLNMGVANVATLLPEQISDDPIHYCYYVGDGSDLLSWVAADGALKLMDTPLYSVVGDADAQNGTITLAEESANVFTSANLAEGVTVKFDFTPSAGYKLDEDSVSVLDESGAEVSDGVSCDGAAGTVTFTAVNGAGKTFTVTGAFIPKSAAEVTSEIEALDAENPDADAVAVARADFDALSAEDQALVGAEAEIKLLKAEAAVAKAKIAELEAAKAEVEQQLQDAQTENDDLAAAKAEAEGQLDKVNAELETAKGDLAKANEALETAASELEKAKGELAGKDAELTQAKDDLAKATEELGKAQAAAAGAESATKDLEAANGKIAELESQLAAAKSAGKADNPMTVKTKAVKAKKAKKTTIAAKKAFAVKGAQGKLTYAKLSGSDKITVKANGKVIVKKGLKKKTYKVKVLVAAAGNAKYAPAAKTVTLKIKVK